MMQLALFLAKLESTCFSYPFWSPLFKNKKKNIGNKQCDIESGILSAHLIDLSHYKPEFNRKKSYFMKFYQFFF